MLSFMDKLKIRQKEESIALQKEVESLIISFDKYPELSDYFFDTQKRTFMKFDDTGKAIPVSELEMARLKRHVKGEKIIF